MVWESGCTVIVMLTPLVEDGVKQCDRYWPDEGSSLYHIYEVSRTPRTGTMGVGNVDDKHSYMYEYRGIYTYICIYTYIHIQFRAQKHC